MNNRITGYAYEFIKRMAASAFNKPTRPNVYCGMCCERWDDVQVDGECKYCVPLWKRNKRK